MDAVVDSTSLWVDPAATSCGWLSGFDWVAP